MIKIDIINRIVAYNYKILEEIDSTRLAQIYKAFDQKNNFIVTIEILKDKIKRIPLTSQLQFKKEVEAISKINHINLLKIYALIEYEGKYHLVAEFFQSKPLSRYLTQSIEIDKAVEIILQVSSGLELCHQKGIIHRGINADSILISPQFFEAESKAVDKIQNCKYIKLTHFGYSLFLDLTRITEADEIQAVFGYLSPEASGILRRPVDERSDIYSLGILFFRLITGEFPYRGEDIPTLIHQHIAQQPKSPGKINKAIPEILDRIVLRLINKEPRNRYQSLSGLIVDLNEYLTQRREGKEMITFTIARNDRLRELTFSTGLIGREGEINQLKSYFEQTRYSKGKLCLICGEAGVGKTRLIEEALGYIYSLNGILAKGKCNQFEFQTPYKIFSEVIRYYLEKLKRRSSQEQGLLIRRMKESLGDLAGEVVKIAPEIIKLVGEPGRLVELEADKEKIRFLITVTNFILSLGTPEIPVIIFLDDLQWADETSIELLGRIAEKINSYPLLIIGGFRDTEVEDTHPLRRIFERLKKGKVSLPEIHLRNLGLEDTRKIISWILLEDENSILALAEDLFKRTQGNPFFLIESLHSLVEDGIVYLKDNHYYYDLSLFKKAVSPESIVGVILKRIEEVSGRNLKLLSYASIIGREIKFEIVQKLLHVSPEELSAAIEEGIKKQFLMGDITRREDIYFVHDRIREAFYQRIKGEERKFVHKEIGELIEKENKDNLESVLYELAYHFIHAELSHKALIYSIKAGHKAKVSYAHDQAIGLYLTAGKILEEQDKTKTDQYIEVLENLGDVYRLSGRFHESLEALRICDALVPESDKMHRAQLLNSIGETLWEKGEIEKAIESLENALEILEVDIAKTKRGVIFGVIKEFLIQMVHTWFPKVFIQQNYNKNRINTVISHLMIRLAYIYYFSNTTRMFYFYLKGLNFTEKKIGPCSELAHFYITGSAAYTTTMFAWSSRVFKYGKLGIEMAKKIGDKIQEGRSYSYFSIPLYISNKPREAREYAQKSINLLKELGEYWEIGIACIFRDHHNCLIGKLSDNIQDNEEFIRIAQEAKVIQALGWALLTKGRLFSLRGDVSPQIIEDLKKSVELLEQTKDHFMAGFALAVLAFAYSRTGEYDQAIEFMEKSKGYYFRYHTGCFLLDMFPMGAEVYFGKILNNPDLKLEERETYLKTGAWFCKQSLAWGRRFPYILGWAYQVNGSYNWLINKNKKAIKLWEKGIRFLRAHTEDKYRLGSILLQESSFLVQKNPRDKKALNYLLEARELFIQRDARLDLERVNTLFEKIGLKEETMESCEVLTQRRYLESLISITEAIGSIFDLEELLGKIMDYALKTTGAEKGVLFIYEGEDNLLKPKVIRGIDKDLLEQNFSYDSFKISLKMIQDVEKTREAVIATGENYSLTGSLAQEKGLVSEFLAELKIYGIKQAMCVPLRVKDRVLGIIYLDNSLASGIFGQKELNLMKSFAVHASIAIENAHLVKNLVEEERFLQKLIEQAPDAMAVYDLEGRIVSINQLACDYIGYTRKELLNMNVSDFDMNLNQEKIFSILEVLEKGPVTLSSICRRKDGSTFPIEVRLTLVEYYGRKLILSLTRDITERRKIEEELQKVAKLESMGVLAGGIAHDFNNLLTAIVGNLSLAELYIDSESKAEAFEVLKDAEKGCQRAAALTKQLLTFSKGGAPVKTSASIKELLEDTVTFTLRGSQVKCEFFIAENLWLAEIDEGQISQVMNNLIINAYQAMPHGGLIKVRAENIFIRKEDSLLLEEGEYIKISIKDQGSGIPKDYLPHIFDPFFTTKKEGSGLGLAISYSIIKKHGGYISVESESGVGTTFYIYLPASKKEILKEEAINQRKLYFGRGKILFMDDQEKIRDMTGNMLNKIGYTVEFARDGAQAIELYKKAKECGDPFDAVILDLTVPGGMGGKEAIMRLLEIDPDIKALVSSGYSSDQVMSEYGKFGFKGVIAKPYEIWELSKVLHQLIPGAKKT